MEENKKEGVQKDENEGVNINNTKDFVVGECLEDQDTLENLAKKKSDNKKFKDLLSLLILFAGIAMGSMFIDFAQYFSKDGYSQRALEGKKVFVAGEQTWVAFDEPVLNVKILNVSDDELADCPECDLSDLLKNFRQVIPTMIAEKIDYNSDEGKEIIENLGVKTLPVMIFDKKVEETGFYGDGASVLFNEVEDQFVLNLAGLGIPVGKYLSNPEIGENSPVIGKRDAQVKIVVFSDFQCPFCSQYYFNVKEIAEKFGEKVVLTYKEFPLDFHEQANNAAIASECAHNQGKFWEMADALYFNQKEWEATQGIDSFKKIASDLGLDQELFSSCVQSEEVRVRIQNDLEEAVSFGVSGAPATFINDKMLSGLIQKEDLESTIDEILNEEDLDN